MTKLDDRDDDVRALYRMIAYIRDEAMRLRIGDVALLLARAEDMAFAGEAPGATDGCHESAERSRVAEH